jgi:hypothetical protein
MKTLLPDILCFSFLLAVSAEADNRVTIDVTGPKSEDKVQEVTDVVGKVSDPKAQVWLVVKPQHASDCWIQTAAAVGKDGKWSVEAHFGDRNTHNESFDIIAIANPKNDKTREGKTKCWPEAASKSKVVHVKRE